MIFCTGIKVSDLASKGVTAQTVVFVPADSDAEEKMRKCEGKTFGVDYRRGRSLPQHRLFFVALRKVFENQNQFRSEDDLREATLIEIGFCELRERFNGERYKVARSMDFRLSQDEFQEKVFDPAVRAWEDHFGYQPGELLNA
ncbi:hypothetical protein GWO43_16165 [candidate division KSB1 bacterium]|nr:hypothetical protein [candidate division KSB1 bacterium]NIV68769.1 hypothetical protein [Phycisphaerae bacterium]NIS25486.1 hypothetical protein [candidate division KSB1 bacterium]NIT72379.1 hypothetical protein [candidate division KSB1 bacterium]NIU26163.1 hypothetical protein [candidate division KSB1 bacterium]